MRSAAVSYQARRHPIMFALIALLLSPYLIAIIGLFLVAWVLAAVLEMIAGRK